MILDYKLCMIYILACDFFRVCLVLWLLKKIKFYNNIFLIEVGLEKYMIYTIMYFLELSSSIMYCDLKKVIL